MLGAHLNVMKIEGQVRSSGLGLLANQALGVPEMVEEIVRPFGRVCTVCGEWKEAPFFHVHASRRHQKTGGLKPWCRPCKARLQGESRQKALDHFRRIEGASRRRESPEIAKNRYMRGRHYALKNKFGISLDDYLSLLDRQNGKCRICDMTIRAFSYKGGKGARESACVDHDHTTGKVRGLLCNPCNTGLGLFGDVPGRLEKAALYLRSYQDG